MYHPLAVHIQQPLGNAFELPGAILSVMGGVSDRSETYKLKPIRIRMCFDELDDIPIGHPFRNHREEPFLHRHSQQREHIRMVEGLPRHNLLAENLRDHSSHQLSGTHF